MQKNVAKQQNLDKDHQQIYKTTRLILKTKNFRIHLATTYKKKILKKKNFFSY